MRTVVLWVGLATLIWGCGPQSEWQQSMRMAQANGQQQVGADFCPERIPAARARLEKLAASGRSRVVGAEVVNPFGGTTSVRIHTGEPYVDDVPMESGLSDLILNCGGALDNTECFVDVYLDGVALASLTPVTEGQVPFTCLTAGQHNLRIENVGRVVFDDVVVLQSDTQYLARIVNDDIMNPRFEIYAENPLPDRIADVRPAPRTPTVIVAAPPTVEPNSPTSPPPNADSVPSNPPDVVPATPPQVPGQALSDADYEDLRKHLTAKRGDRDRLEALETELSRMLITSTQAVGLVEMFDDAKYRIAASLDLFPVVTDQHRYYRVLDLLETKRDKRIVCIELDLQLDECGVAVSKDPVGETDGYATETVVRHEVTVTVGGTHPELPPSPGPHFDASAMPDRDFQEFLTTVDDSSFDDDKLERVRMTAAAAWFTASQAAALVDAMTFSDGKVEAAVLLHPRLTDPGNFFRVLEQLDFDSDREKVKSQLGM